MDAGQLFEQLQKKSKQNPNDIAVVLDAMITTIQGKTSENKTIEFADFGVFEKSGYDKIDFKVSDEFAKIVNYKYSDMEPVVLSESETARLSQQESSENEITIDDVHEETGMFSIPEPVENKVSSDSQESFEEMIGSGTDTLFMDDGAKEENLIHNGRAEKPLQEEKPSGNFTLDVNRIEEDSASAGNLDSGQESSDNFSVSSQVTEILDEIQTQPSIVESSSQTAAYNTKPEPKKNEPIAGTFGNVRKLDTIIEDSSVSENVKENPMQSYQSTGYQEPKMAEFNDGGYGGGLSNSELGKESDTKKWIIIISIIVVAVAAAIWIAFHADSSDSAQKTDESQQTAQPVDSVVTQQQDAVPAPSTAAPVTDTKKTASKNSKDAKPASKESKPAPAKSKPAAAPVTDASGKITINYTALKGVEGLTGGYDQKKGGYTISVSSWSKKPVAEKEVSKWENAGVAAHVQEIYLVDKGGYWYRVRLGQFASRKSALSSLEEVKVEIPDAYIDTIEP